MCSTLGRMARRGSILFVTWSGGGNIPPTLTLARWLRERGHEVRVLAGAELADRFAAADIPLRSYRAEEAWRSGLAADVEAEARRVPTDLVVVDYMQPAAMCGVEAAGLRVVALVHTLYAKVAVVEDSPMYMAMTDDALATLRADLDLAHIDRLTDLLGRAARALVLTTRAFDAPELDTPANVCYVGPIVEEAGDDAGWSPPLAHTRPLVLVGLGTTPMNEGPVLQTVLAALESLPVQVFVTIGAHLDRANFRIPENAVVAGFVQHAAVLPHAAMFLTHAGMGGIGAALSSGVPMLCIPLGREQPQNAARVEAMGAGRVLGVDATVADLRAAVTELLDDGRYRIVAEAAASEIRAIGSGTRAIEELETLMG
jgi:MGT family glycosyltransferase